MNGKKNIWAPQKGPQKALIDCPVYEIFYGGARGGGKTDGVLGKMALKALRYGRGFNCVFFRHELPMLDDAIERSKEIFSPYATYRDHKKTWQFQNGARFRFRPLESVKDAEKYQGQNLTDVCIEEAGNYPDPKPIQKLHGALRSANQIPTQMHLTGNPGGPGQHWIRERYIDPNPDGYKIIREKLPNGRVKARVFIPAKVKDNRLLLRNDPDYVSNLYLVGSQELVRAWLEGDWNAIEGAFFDTWSNQNIIKPFAIPGHWTRFRSMDWGSAKPFSVGWWAIVGDDFISPDGIIPRGALIRYKEWYGKKSPNVGLKLTAEKVGEGIAERSRGEPKASYGVADPSMWAEDGGPSLIERVQVAERKKAKELNELSTPWRKADNKRVSGQGRSLGSMGGWDMMRQRIEGDERPMIYCFSTCKDSTRTIPVLQHDENRPEDLDTNMEDHAADEWRYACMSRPWVKTEHKPAPEPTDPWGRRIRASNNWKTN